MGGGGAGGWGHMPIVNFAQALKVKVLLQLLKQLAAEPAYSKVICVGRRKVKCHCSAFQISRKSTKHLKYFCILNFFDISDKFFAVSKLYLISSQTWRSVSTDFDTTILQVDLPSEPGMEKVEQEEIIFDNISEYSSAFPRYYHVL